MAVTQCSRILRHLNDFGSITAAEAMEQYGIQRLAARINDLRVKGIDIYTEMQPGKNRYGEDVHYAVYRLAQKEE